MPAPIRAKTRRRRWVALRRMGAGRGLVPTLWMGVAVEPTKHSRMRSNSANSARCPHPPADHGRHEHEGPQHRQQRVYRQDIAPLSPEPGPDSGCRPTGIDAPPPVAATVSQQVQRPSAPDFDDDADPRVDASSGSPGTAHCPRSPTGPSSVRSADRPHAQPASFTDFAEADPASCPRAEDRPRPALSGRGELRGAALDRRGERGAVGVVDGADQAPAALEPGLALGHDLELGELGLGPGDADVVGEGLARGRRWPRTRAGRRPPGRRRPAAAGWVTTANTSASWGSSHARTFSRRTSVPSGVSMQSPGFSLA